MLTTDMDKKEDAGSDDKVTLMTVHSAKGLEFKYVYIVGLEENLFPSQRAAESPEVSRRSGACSTWPSRGQNAVRCSPMPRCVSSGATWSSRVRAASCARSTPAISTARSVPTRRPCAKRPQPAAARRSKSCAGVSTCAISSGRPVPAANRRSAEEEGIRPNPARAAPAIVSVLRGRRAAARAMRTPPFGALRCNAPLHRRICGGSMPCGARRRKRCGIGLYRRRAGRTSQVRARSDRAYRDLGGRP